MNDLNYVLRTVEAVRVPQSGKNSMKIFVLIILGILLVGSFIFGENLFKELSWLVKLLLILLILKVIFSGGWEFKPFPIEISFFDDGLQVQREEVYYNKKLTRKEIYNFNYSDLECTYHTHSKRMELRGFVKAELFDYVKGVAPSSPTDIKEDTGICYFYTSAAPEVDFVAEIESHSPLKVTIVNN